MNGANLRSQDLPVSVTPKGVMRSGSADPAADLNKAAVATFARPSDSMPVR